MPQLPGAGAGVELETNFPGATQHPVTRLGPDHFRIDFPPGRQEAGFFLFTLRHVAGRTVTIDLQSDRAQNWRTLNPVFAHLDPQLPVADQLADPALFACRPPPELRPDLGRNIELPQGLGGSTLPLTHGIFQQWRYMPASGVNPQAQDQFRVVHTFPKDAPGLVAVAMKVPYTPQLLDRLVQDLQDRHAAEPPEPPEAQAPKRPQATSGGGGGGGEPDWEVVQVGESAQGRPLWLIRIGEAMRRADDQPPFAPPPQRSQRPVVLFYAREHADEHDTSWVAQGVIDFLLSDHPDARAIRKRVTVLIIPLLDPDGAVANQYESKVIMGFDDDPDRTPEALAWAEYFRGWVDAGNRLDLVFNLHNVESGEGPHLFVYVHEPDRLEASHQLHHAVARFLGDHYATRDTKQVGWVSTRLGGWLRRIYGSHQMFYEVNSQAPKRHLSLYELKALGPGILAGALRYLHSPAAAPLRRDLQDALELREMRQHRYWNLSRVLNTFDEDVFGNETTLGSIESAEQYAIDHPEVNYSWLRPLYDRIERGELAPTPPWKR